MEKQTKMIGSWGIKNPQSGDLSTTFGTPQTENVTFTS